MIDQVKMRDNMGFYSGVYSGICKIGLKSHKTSICCHPNSSAASGPYTHVKKYLLESGIWSC